MTAARTDDLEPVALQGFDGLRYLRPGSEGDKTCSIVEREPHDLAGQRTRLGGTQPLEITADGQAPPILNAASILDTPPSAALP